MPAHNERRQVLSPSAFGRTVHCRAWGLFPRAWEAPGESAAKGIVAHWVAAECLRKETPAAVFLGTPARVDKRGNVFMGGKDQARPAGQQIIEVDDDMVEGVQTYVDYCIGAIEKFDDPVIVVEQRATPEWIYPGMTGYVDFACAERGKYAVIVDLKYGRHVVPAEDNAQLMLYALSVLGPKNPLNLKGVQVAIVQPRGFDGAPVKEALIKAPDLYTWLETVARPAAVEAMESDMPRFKPGDWCKFCPGIESGQCPSIKQTALVITNEHPDIPDPARAPVSPGGLTGPDLDRILKWAPLVEKWFTGCRAEARARLERGAPDAPSAHKLVAGNLSNRKWRDESIVYDRLKTLLPRKEVYKPETVNGVPAIEKALAKHGYAPEELINPLLEERTPGPSILVPAEDSRPALRPMFDDYDPFALPTKGV